LTDRDGSTAGVVRSLGRREIHLGPVFALAGRHKIGVILGLGAAFRIAQYLADRSLWLDEGSLRGNIARMTWRGLTGPLAGTQLAPPGFIAFEWAALRVLGDSRLALRLVPLIGGLASLGLFAEVARRCLRPRGVLIAAAMFAVSDDLIYFASELKQYSTDVAAGLACLLSGVVAAGRPPSARERLGATALGAAVVWFSHPSAFVLAGVGTVLLASAAARRDWRDLGLQALTCLAWAASFAAVYSASASQLGHRRDMWAFWAFAFPPSPPITVANLAWWLRRASYLFVNPLNFATPLGTTASALPPLAFALVGGASMARRRPSAFGMIALPGLFAAAAASLHLYPFHGRLLLFLVPMLLLTIAEGAESVARAIGARAGWAVVVGSLLLFPTLLAGYRLVDPRDRGDFNPRGDLRPASLDPDDWPSRRTPPVGVVPGKIEARPGVSG